ncbi:hypothetical protein [Sphingomonas faeni]|uniref:hypothetical protein n=1 Tax=Sphingomonas faeni TaxID=185950 RepID=UPI0011B1D737|nr:hypothetical protein [Sphingomonas faeni]
MFICTVSPGGPVPIVILRGNEEFLARVPVGFDDDTGAVYSVFAALSPLIGYADVPGYECVFSIIEASHDEAHMRDCWDGLETEPLIPDSEHRGHILNLICMVVGRLVDAAQPGIVSMTTHSPNLPEKALLKFNQICTVFHEKGYTVWLSDSYHGRYVWMMERKGDGTVSA